MNDLQEFEALFLRVGIRYKKIRDSKANMTILRMVKGAQDICDLVFYDENFSFYFIGEYDE